MKKYRWAIVADLIRALSNPSSYNFYLSDTAIEYALKDIAAIMDTMMVNKCGFEKAVIIERENDSCFGEWIEETIQHI